MTLAMCDVRLAAGPTLRRQKAAIACVCVKVLALARGFGLPHPDTSQHLLPPSPTSQRPPLPPLLRFSTHGFAHLTGALLLPSVESDVVQRTSASHRRHPARERGHHPGMPSDRLVMLPSALVRLTHWIGCRQTASCRPRRWQAFSVVILPLLIGPGPSSWDGLRWR